MSSSANKKLIFSKILVAIDSSDASMDAADYATAISQRYNAELYALHVIHADVELGWPHVTSEFMRNMRNEDEKYLDKVKVKANEKSNWICIMEFTEYRKMSSICSQCAFGFKALQPYCTSIIFS